MHTMGEPMSITSCISCSMLQSMIHIAGSDLILFPSVIKNWLDTDRDSILLPPTKQVSYHNLLFTKMLFNNKTSSAKFAHSPSDTDAGLLLLQLRQQPENTLQPSSLFHDSIPSISFDDNDILLNNGTPDIDRRDYFLSREISTSTRSQYMKNQPNINQEDRTRIINWLMDIKAKNSIQTSNDDDDDESIKSGIKSSATVHFAINFMDRYLTKVIVRSVTELFIIGSTCLLLASKSIDCQHTSLTIYDMVSVLKEDKIPFSKHNIIEMEHQVLKVLDYSLYVPTSYSFIDVYWNLNLVDDDTFAIANRILLLCLLSYDALKYLPSEIATAALWMARKIKGNMPKWTDLLVDGTTYSEDRILPVVLDISMMFSTALISVEDDLEFRERRLFLLSTPKLPSVMQSEDNDDMSESEGSY